MGVFSNLSRKLAQRSGEKHAKYAEQKQQHRREYLLDKNTPFDITEAFRNLKAALSVSVPKKRGGVAIMATSAYPNDGKTTVSVNLALMFANSEAKVLLIDADIRKGRVSRYFKHKSTPGLSDYLSGQNSLEEIVHTSHDNPNLSYVFCGTHSPKPYELLESAEMKSFLKKMRSQYDYILVDTPPVLLVSDALALAPLVDGVALICRHQVSYVSDIARAINSLQFAKANVLGVIVNDYKAAPAHKAYDKHGKYYNYRYGYGYGYGSAPAAIPEVNEPLEESENTELSTASTAPEVSEEV